MRRKRSGRLRGLLARWPWRSGAKGTRPETRSRQKIHHGQRDELDWRIAQAQLAPVRHRWDLAVLCNLDATTGRRPAYLLKAINSQAPEGQQLSPQVLSGRLRELEHDGYIRHEDLSVIPMHRVYYLQPPGQTLISDLSRIVSQS